MTLTTEQLKTRIEALRNSASGIASTFSGDADALEELLRYREAQPLYQYRMRNPYNRQVTDWETIKPEQVDFILKETIAANVEFRIIAAPPAPAVPEEMKRDPDADVFDPGFMNGWNACRAAMLAQPVSGGYKLASGCQWAYDEVDFKWDSSCGESWQFIDGGPSENGVKFCQGCGKPVLLAAAPEGGNDHDTRR